MALLDVELSLCESAQVEVPDEILARGDGAVHEYLHGHLGNPWGMLEVPEYGKCSIEIDYKPVPADDAQVSQPGSGPDAAVVESEGGPVKPSPSTQGGGTLGSHL